MLWAVLIVFLSSLSGPQVNQLNVFELWDKAAHFIAFAVGAALVAFALRISTKWSWSRIAIFASLAVSIFGALDEWHQLYTPKRSGADVADWVADTLGAVVAVTITRFLYVRSQRKNRPAPKRN